MLTWAQFQLTVQLFHSPSLDQVQPEFGKLKSLKLSVLTQTGNRGQQPGSLFKSHASVVALDPHGG